MLTKVGAVLLGYTGLTLLAIVAAGVAVGIGWEPADTAMLMSTLVLSGIVTGGVGFILIVGSDIP